MVPSARLGGFPIYGTEELQIVPREGIIPAAVLWWGLYGLLGLVVSETAAGRLR